MKEGRKERRKKEEKKEEEKKSSSHPPSHHPPTSSPSPSSSQSSPPTSSPTLLITTNPPLHCHPSPPSLPQPSRLPYATCSLALSAPTPSTSAATTTPCPFQGRRCIVLYIPPVIPAYVCCSATSLSIPYPPPSPPASPLRRQIALAAVAELGLDSLPPTQPEAPVLSHHITPHSLPRLGPFFSPNDRRSGDYLLP
ncbi:hypothetical protein BZA77DRAFT_299281 [Pyronema omphalodes]|nr:hypothetical protein BZA77DRAFT_299281 [Pyronema omphalodes]